MERGKQFNGWNRGKKEGLKRRFNKNVKPLV
jgi:hypothetical protein